MCLNDQSAVTRYQLPRNELTELSHKSQGVFWRSRVSDRELRMRASSVPHGIEEGEVDTAATVPEPEQIWRRCLHEG
jgi:hypothetical protein